MKHSNDARPFAIRDGIKYFIYFLWMTYFNFC